MKRTIISYILVFALIVPLFTVGLIFGTSEREQLSNVYHEIDKKEKELAEGQKQEKTLLSQMQDLEHQVNLTQAEIDALRNSINGLQANIEVALAGLAALEADLDEQNDALNKRLRAMYINGNISILDVLLGSKSIGDFMTNMDRVKLIYESDKEVIESLEEQHRILDTQREYLEKLQAELVAEREKESNKREVLRQNRNAVAVKKTEVAANNKEIEKMLDALEKAANALVAKILAMQSDSEYVGGDMAWPVPGAKKVTSEFGYRVHPILKTNKMHTGMDIACPEGTKVVASNSGRVIMAGWNDSYGNFVAIDHGGGRVTLYAHNNSLSVKVGDVVVRGEEIARSGSTGMSTGPHLHFEVRINGEYKDPRGYL